MPRCCWALVHCCVKFWFWFFQFSPLCSVLSGLRAPAHCCSLLGWLVVDPALGLLAGLRLGFVCRYIVVQVFLVVLLCLYLGGVAFVVCVRWAAAGWGVYGKLLLATCRLSLVLAVCHTRHLTAQLSFVVWLLCFVLWGRLFGLVCLACRVVAIGRSRPV